MSIGLSPKLLRLTSDSRLVALTREGRTAAFEVAYDRHHRAILSFCRHMLGDREEAQDAVQHTFLAAYNSMLKSDRPIQLRAWLFTIARNRCYSILRTRREQPSGDLSEALTEGLATQVQRRQDLRDLLVDLQRLPEEQRAALVLAELDALSHQEISDVLGVPRDKVKALVFQARESLIASRTARETDCSEIREQLATLRGGSLRRSNLRRHLRECSGCRDFRKQVERQRRQLAVLLPVGPSLAVKELVIAGTVAGGAAAGAVSGGGLLATSALKGGAFKVLMGAVAAGIGTAGTIAVSQNPHLLSPAPVTPHHHHGLTARAAAATAPAGQGAAVDRSGHASAPAVVATVIPTSGRRHTTTRFVVNHQRQRHSHRHAGAARRRRARLLSDVSSRHRHQAKPRHAHKRLGAPGAAAHKGHAAAARHPSGSRAPAGRHSWHAWHQAAASRSQTSHHRLSRGQVYWHPDLATRSLGIGRPIWPVTRSAHAGHRTRRSASRTHRSASRTHRSAGRTHRSASRAHRTRRNASRTHRSASRTHRSASRTHRSASRAYQNARRAHHLAHPSNLRALVHIGRSRRRIHARRR